MSAAASEPQAFGAGRAGTPFNFLEFLKRPQVILRILAWVCAIIVFACIAQEGYWGGKCRYNDTTACGYGIAIGVIAFVLAMVFMGIDIYFPNISNINARKMIVLVELVVSGIWTLLWFVGFCYMTDQWRQEPNQNLPGWNGRNSVQAALAFTFFSFLIWGALSFFAFRRFRQGVSNLFGSNFDTHGNSAPAAAAPHTYGISSAANPTIFNGVSPPPFTAHQSMPSEYEKPNY